jgi:hypothetical protein
MPLWCTSCRFSHSIRLGPIAADSIYYFYQKKKLQQKQLNATQVFKA